MAIIENPEQVAGDGNGWPGFNCLEADPTALKCRSNWTAKGDSRLDQRLR